MADFGIKQLPMDEETGSRVYHLFSRDGSLRMVADFASPWLTSENPDRYVRFADSAGKTVAQMDLAITATKSFGNRQSRDYAIVLNHAVYAILSEYRWQSKKESKIYFLLRVADSMWLILKGEGRESYFTIYNEVPPSLISRSAEPNFSDLPEPTGEIGRDSDQYDYVASWRQEGIRRIGLVVLALVFLIDRLEDV